MTSEQVASDAFQCAQVLNRFFYYLDEFRYEDLVALMPEDGTWFRQGQLLRGRGQILATLNERSRTQRIRHIITNTVVDVAEPGKAVGTAYLTVYKFDDGTELKRSPTIEGPFRISLVQVKFTKASDKWLIAEQHIAPQFEFSSREPVPVAAISKSETAGKSQK
jgi:hypothetical protein